MIGHRQQTQKKRPRVAFFGSAPYSKGLLCVVAALFFLCTALGGVSTASLLIFAASVFVCTALGAVSLAASSNTVLAALMLAALVLALVAAAADCSECNCYD